MIYNEFTFITILLLILALFFAIKKFRSLNQFISEYQEANTVISLLTFIIYFLTLIALISYVVDTHRMAVQSESGHLRPVILREGYITDINSIRFNVTDGHLRDGKPIVFAIKNQIATDISGYIIINYRQYPLFLTSESVPNGYLERLGWQSPETKISAVFDNRLSEYSPKEDSILIYYSDIEGRKYLTEEIKKGEAYIQKSIQL